MEEIKLLSEKLNKYIKDNWRRSMNEPVGVLGYKFLDPAADYRGQLWDWDSFFCGMALIDVYEDTYEYVEGCVRNFLNHQNEDGSVPYMIDVGDEKEFTYALPKLEKKPRSADSELNSVKPLLAQMAMLAYGKSKDCWI